MNVWKRLEAYLPPLWMERLAALPESQKQRVQEIRIRAEQPLRVSTPTGDCFVSADGLTQLPQPGVPVCCRRDVEDCVRRLCQESVYAHQEELKQGFIAVPGGIRVGIAGRAVRQGDEVVSIQEVTSLCVRLPRRHPGCAAGLLPYIVQDGQVVSSLLVGEPSSGKTTLLRDLAIQLAGRGFRIAVVDEREEIAGVDGLSGCDVLCGYPKAAGIRQALRCLAPQAVLFDELGDEREVEAVAACAHAGVAVIASLHGTNWKRLACRPAARQLIEHQMVDRWLFLSGRSRPGEVAACMVPEVKGREVDWTYADCGGRNRAGVVCFPPAEPSGDGLGEYTASYGGAAAADDVYYSSHNPAMAAAGR